MGEHKIPRSPASEPEGFVVREVATGQSFNIREMSDVQLAKHLNEANQQHQILTRQAMEMIGQSVNAAKAAACLARSIQIVQRIQ